MKTFAIFFSLLLLLASCSSDATKSAVVPAPILSIQKNGEYTFNAESVISVENESQAAVAAFFADLFTVPAGFIPIISTGSDKGTVLFNTDSSFGKEEYSIDVSDKSIIIKAGDDAGFFYALQTLRQMLPPAIDGNVFSPDTKWSVPAVKIKDSPRFEYRGLMLDVSRYFMPKKNVLQIIDCMAMLKLNKMHMHLSDDNGWRIEIKKYPRLTSVGAWRVDRGNVPFPDRENPKKSEPTPIGGFYTQDDIREIVAYAADRQIEIIPEIDIPAHSNAALAAYPQYACPTVDRFIGVLPGIGGSNADIIFCAGNDATFHFIQDILDEVFTLFPSKYIHLGGDEAWKTNWKTCPLCQKRIAKEGLADEEALQGYFMSRMNDYVRSKGKTMMGWDELTNSEVPEKAVVFGWQDDGTAALKAAEQGHRFIMTPAKLMYLIRYQGPQWFEPLTYFGNNTLKDVYDYEPVQADWKPEYENLLMGVQGSMWTEFCSSPRDVEYQIFPRLAAVAAVAWSQKGQKDWKTFLRALDVFTAHLDAKGVNYAKSMYNIQHTAKPAGDGKVLLTLECIRPDVKIRYTTDGSEPSVSATEYSSALIVNGGDTIKAATFFKEGTQAGKTLTLPILYSKATGKPVKGNAEVAKLMTNGIRGSLKQSDFEWSGGSDKVSFVIDLIDETPVSKIVVGCLTNYGMMVNKPSEISVAISSDNENFKTVATRKFTVDELFTKGNFIEDISFDFTETKARYIRISATGAGLCPQWHVRPGKESRFCFDEIIVY